MIVIEIIIVVMEAVGGFAAKDPDAATSEAEKPAGVDRRKRRERRGRKGERRETRKRRRREEE